jgi:hypothetical protein
VTRCGPYRKAGLKSSLLPRMPPTARSAAFAIAADSQLRATPMSPSYIAAIQLISTTAPSSNNSVTPTAVQAGKGSLRNSPAMGMRSSA